MKLSKTLYVSEHGARIPATMIITIITKNAIIIITILLLLLLSMHSLNRVHVLGIGLWGMKDVPLNYTICSP